MYVKSDRLMLMLTKNCSFLDKPPSNKISENFLGWSCPLQILLHIKVKQAHYRPRRAQRVP
jgi:hypothetical protein